MKHHGKIAALLLLSAVLALTACGSEEAAGGTEQDSETVMASSTVAASPVTEEAEAAAREPQLIGGNGTGTGVLGGTSGAETSFLPLPDGSLEGDSLEISGGDANTVEQEIALSGALQFGPNPASGSAVTVRDWSKYSSDYVKIHLTEAEQTLWDRMVEMGDTYIGNSSLDGVRNEKYGLYLTGGVPFSDLGLTKEQVKNVKHWFRYNNPQYWFLDITTLLSGDSVYFCLYETASDGEARADITNRMFDTVDAWAAEIAESGTAYEKVKAAHDMLCTALDYSLGGAYCQSIYSTFVENRTVCAGYAGGMTVLLNAVGVKTITILNDTHAWNAVHMDDGSWYGEDATLSDGMTSFNDSFLLVSDANLWAGDSGGYQGMHEPNGYAAGWVPKLAAENYKP